jgi:hypothetical protein
MQKNLDKIDPTFVSDLMNSDIVTWIVARALRRNGYSIRLPPIGVRPDPTQLSEFGDDGDLYVDSYLAPIEVKQRPDMSFQSIDTFEYKDIIVDVAHHWKDMTQKPLSYIITNRDVTGGIIVPSSSSSDWKTDNRWDSKRKRRRTFLLCDTNRCGYWDFASLLTDDQKTLIFG